MPTSQQNEPQSEPDNNRTVVVDDLSMLVRRLAHSLKKANPDNELASQALDYLRRKGLNTPMREANKDVS